MKGLLFFLLILSSCGSLRLNPRGCASRGQWGEGNAGEIAFTQNYYVLNFNRNVILKDFLQDRNIDCREVKKIRVGIKSVLLVKRELTVFVQK